MSHPRRKPSPQPIESRPAALPATRFLDLAIGLALIVSIFMVYGQVSHFDFIYYDDPVYVYQNEHVESGLTIDSVKWAFTGVVAGNWAPVTSLSHILVFQLFRLQSGMHHLVNVVIHALAALLLFASLRRATHARWPSAFAAFVFALHPLHVESVAWVAERKDVLCAFFWFLALYAYVRYTEQPSLRRYLLMVLPFCLGLMSKSMLVTFPFTLCLFDIWPLRRAPWPPQAPPVQSPTPWKLLVWEKLPLMALCAGLSVVAYLTQEAAKATFKVALPMRIENTLISYVTYIWKMFWPTRLSWFYMYPNSIPLWQAVSAGVVLAAVSALAILTWRTRPYIATGWFWYLGTLVPVIGMVQIGGQSHADRYTYIPMVGLSLLLAWGATDIIARWPRSRTVLAAAGAAFSLTCMALAANQTSYWQDGPTLFQHAVDVTEDNLWAKYNLASVHYGLGNQLMNSGRRTEAIAHFEEALRVRPNWAEAHNNLGILLAEVPGRTSEALGHFEAAVIFDPKLAQAQRNFGMALAAIPGRTAEAIAHLEAAQHLQPDPQVLAVLTRLRALSK